MASSMALAMLSRSPLSVSKYTAAITHTFLGLQIRETRPSLIACFAIHPTSVLKTLPLLVGIRLPWIVEYR